MRILELQLKNFGKFNKQTYQSGNGIWLFYGENESGKSTIHTFIKAMLFGLERGRGRASVNDTFSRYEPWENSNYYSGVMRFECGEKTFRLERNFDKYSKKAVLTCEDDGEVLSVEGGDLQMLLSGLTASEYTDTLYIGQLCAKTGQGLLAELKNYATNYYVSGDSEIDLYGALELLKKKRKEEENKEKKFEQDKIKERDKIEQEISYIWRDLQRVEEEISAVDSRIQETEQCLQKETENEVCINRKSKWRIHPLEIVGMLILMTGAFVEIIKPWNYLVGIILALAGGIYIWNRIKDGKSLKESDGYIQDASEKNTRLVWEKEHLNKEWQEKNIQYENLNEQLHELNEVDVQTEDIKKHIQAYEIAKERLEQVSYDMQQQLSTQLNDNASEILADITDGKYTKLFVDDKLHMSVMAEGKRIEMEMVSQGTLEQIYFSVRMAAADLLLEEEYPVILDETFAFYDENRLRKVLKWLGKSKRQVIIFTCQKREEEILKEENILYHKTEVK